MATQADIDRNNVSYNAAKTLADAALARGDSAAAHEQHKIMQRAAEENTRLAPIVSKANDDWHRANKTGPYAQTTTSSSSSSSSPSYASTASVTPKPTGSWITNPPASSTNSVKQADPDIVLFDSETISPELLIQLEYENISGAELINISRSDIIDGQQVVYSPIKNLSSLRRKYNPNNIIAISSNSDSIFSKFLIDLIQRGAKEPYFDNNGDLVVEIEDLFDDEVIEIEVDVSGTIDTVEFL